MKTITNVKITVIGDKMTMTADVADIQFSGFLTTRVTHGHLNPDNTRHPRHVQSSSEAVFVKHGRFGVAIPNDVLIEIAAQIEPKTSFAPLLKSPKPLTVSAISESEVSYQWMIFDGKDWKPIEGETKDELNKSKVKADDKVKCVVGNLSGSSESNVEIVK